MPLQGETGDKVVGMFFVLFGVFCATYYTTWVYITPVLSKDSLLLMFFLPRVFALIIPSIMIIAFAVFLWMFLTGRISKSNRR